jgi:octaprenyl-diphosphate synthase
MISEAAHVGSLKDIVRLVEGDLNIVEDIIAEQLASPIPLIQEMGRYIQASGGKRIRPALLLLSARLCGAMSERAHLLAAVVEFIHTATLLHDDVIDQAGTRRGRATVNQRWGNGVAVLLGDLLFSKSMSIALSRDHLHILRLLANVTVQMTEGEILEIERQGRLDVTIEEHVALIRRKTACLFSAATQIGAMLGERSPERERALADYGLQLGLCFQMVDDLLDFEGEERVLGKPVGHDIAEGKLTLPAILMLRDTTSAGAHRMRTFIRESEKVAVHLGEIMALARDTGVLQEARRLAEDCARAAQDALVVFPDSVFKQALMAVPGFVLARKS